MMKIQSRNQFFVLTQIARLSMFDALLMLETWRVFMVKRSRSQGRSTYKQQKRHKSVTDGHMYGLKLDDNSLCRQRSKWHCFKIIRSHTLLTEIWVGHTIVYTQVYTTPDYGMTYLFHDHARANLGPHLAR